MPVALIELGILGELNKLPLYFSPLLVSILYWFLGVAFVEEIFKYLVIKGKVIMNSEFDEPSDVMLYMIIVALGFAALENILVLFPWSSPFLFLETSLLCASRFIGATFLHALCSGALGYFLALSFFETKKRIRLTMIGLGIAVFLHGLYDFSIMRVEGGLKFAIPIIILISLALFVSYGFKNLKTIKSTCQLK